MGTRMPTIRVNDINVYYEMHGEGEPLVLIPGLSIDITAFERIISELAQQYTVIAFDNRGAGRTDKPDIPYSIGMMADDTAGLLAALGITHAHVLGVSMGGRIATELTLRHPEMVKSLILVSTFVKRIPIRRRGVMFNLAITFPFVRRIGKRYPQPQYAFERQLQASRDYDASDRLPEISVPTLILQGRTDRQAPIQAAEEMHAGIHGSRLIAFDGGHLILFFRQKQVLDAVRVFLGAQSEAA